MATEPSGSFSNAELVGAKTVKGGSRLVPLGKATVMAASRVEKRLSVESTSPVVGSPAAGENGLEPAARPEPAGGERATPPSSATPPPPPPGVQWVYDLRSQVPQPTLRSGLGDGTPPQGIIFFGGL